MRSAIAAAFGLVAMAAASEKAAPAPAAAAPAAHAPPPAYAPPAPYIVHKNFSTKTTVYTTYTTVVVPTYETYCPSAMSIEHNGVTYAVTEPATLTITNCPCTITQPVYSTASASSSSTSTWYATRTPMSPACPEETPNVPVPPQPLYPSNNVTVPAQGPPPTGTGAYTPPATTRPITPGYTGAAHKASFGIAGVVAAAGFLAAF